MDVANRMIFLNILIRYWRRSSVSCTDDISDGSSVVEGSLTVVGSIDLDWSIEIRADRPYGHLDWDLEKQWALGGI